MVSNVYLKENSQLYEYVLKEQTGMITCPPQFHILAVQGGPPQNTQNYLLEGGPLVVQASPTR